MERRADDGRTAIVHPDLPLILKHGRASPTHNGGKARPDGNDDTSKGVIVMTKTVMFVHGAWLTPKAWDGWRAHFEAAGYRTVAPTWPHMERSIDALRRSPAPALAKLNVVDIVDHYAAEIAKLDELPIIIGHSFGGLITLMLMDRGLGVAGAVLDPAPPRGVIPGLRSILSALPVLTSWNGWNRVLTMSRKGFSGTFANTLPAGVVDTAYDTYVVPAPGRPYFQASLGIGNGVSFKGLVHPLLLIAGLKDKTADPAMIKRIWRAYDKQNAPAEFATYPNRSHFLFAEAGWEEIADDVLVWLAKRGVAPRAQTTLIAAE
jgi:pimeloyl-ACP methyl ester carboxylesterase